MDLDFVDPPLSPSMEPYQPRIGPEESAVEIRNLAEWFRSNDFPQQIWEQDALDRVAEGMKEPEVAEQYARHVPFVARFLTVELDTIEHGKQAIGRMPGEGPPRFGGKYRRKLEGDAVVRERIGPIFERLMFAGFAGAAGVNASFTETEPQEFKERSTDDRWRRFIRDIGPNYWELGKPFDPRERPVPAMLLAVAGEAIADYMDVIQELRIGRGKRGRAKTYATFLVTGGFCIWQANTSPD